MDPSCNILVAAPTAPDLILDLLIAHSGTLPVQVLCRAGDLIGMGQSAIRVALTRLVSQGKITRSARGSYVLDRSSGPALSSDVDDWRHKGSEAVTWRGHWLAVHDAGVLRSDKTGWRHHILALELRGLAAFQPGLQLRPDNLKGGVEAVRTQLQALGLSPHALVFRLDGLDPARQAEACGLWNVARLQTQYCSWQQALESSARRLPEIELEKAVRESLLLGRAVISRLIRDPLLPPELMRPEARLALVQTMKDYQRQALTLWQTWMQLP